MTLLDDLPGWGAVVKLTGPTESVSVTQVNNRIVLKVGRNGTQTVTIPNATTLIAGARILILGDDVNLGSGKEATIVDTLATISVEVDAYSEVYELLWTGTEWVIAGSSTATIAWGDVTGKPTLGGAVGTVFIGDGDDAGTFSSTPQVDKVKFSNASREITIPTTTIIRCAGNALESYGPERLQSSISPVVSYGGTDARVQTGYRVFVHCYDGSGVVTPSVQTIDFDLTYLTADSGYQPQVAVNAFRMMAIASFYADGGGVGEVAHFETKGTHYDNPAAGRGASATTTVAAGAYTGTPSTTFAWSAPSAGVLRLTFTPPSVDNVTLALRLEVLGTKGSGPNSGT
jgi:hypothetical protein